MRLLSNNIPEPGRKIRCRFCGDLFDSRMSCNVHGSSCVKVARGEKALPKSKVRTKRKPTIEAKSGIAKQLRDAGADSVYKNKVLIDAENNTTVDLFVFDEMLDIDLGDFF